MLALTPSDPPQCGSSAGRSDDSAATEQLPPVSFTVLPSWRAAAAAARQVNFRGWSAQFRLAHSTTASPPSVAVVAMAVCALPDCPLLGPRASGEAFILLLAGPPLSGWVLCTDVRNPAEYSLCPAFHKICSPICWRGPGLAQ